MREITLEELLEAGCHFGHQVTRQNPKARDFVFEARDNIHIIDLAKTKEGLEEAAAFINALAFKGGSLLVVGTKRQARDIVKQEVERARSESLQLQVSEGQAENKLPQNDIFYVNNRWVGGTMTNFSESSKNYKKLKDLTKMLQSQEERAKYTKKEVGLLEKERAKLTRYYEGLSDMKQIPDALFIIDTHSEDLAVREAEKTEVKTVGIVDTNADPTTIDFPIPANDDAVGSIKLITSYIIDAWIEGKKTQKSSIRQVIDSEMTQTFVPRTQSRGTRGAQDKSQNQEPEKEVKEKPENKKKEFKPVKVKEETESKGKKPKKTGEIKTKKTIKKSEVKK